MLPVHGAHVLGDHQLNLVIEQFIPRISEEMFGLSIDHGNFGRFVDDEDVGRSTLLRI